VILVVYGTTGELIKLSPILTSLKTRGTPAFTLCTAQQVSQIPQLLDAFELPQPDLWLSRGKNGRDLTRASDIPLWLMQVASEFTRRRSLIHARLRSSTGKPLLMVHGDTFTTVLGCLMGRVLRIPVAHVEAGMRSGSLRDPFPEELDRLAAARLARIHFAPGPRAAENLLDMKVRGEIVDTGSNTIHDALGLVRVDALDVEVPSGPFGLVSLHRFELLGKAAELRSILELLRETSRSTPLLFVDHPVTATAIEAGGLGSMFDDRFKRIPRLPYFEFVALLKASVFLVTDSGGSQQECAQLGHPCLVHRAVTEHSDGLDGPVVLSRMDLEIARVFLENPQEHASPPVESSQHPTDLIIGHLESRGYLIPAPVEVSVAL
jgi:UDP-N-acetylglucosamine 2-epimerase (non-hydrolysing)